MACCPWSHGLRSKGFKRCHQLLSEFLANVPCADFLVSQLDNGMIPGAVHRSPEICFTAKENPQKTAGRRPSDEGCATSHRLKWGPFPPNDVSSPTARQEEWRKEGKDGVGFVGSVYSLLSWGDWFVTINLPEKGKNGWRNLMLIILIWITAHLLFDNLTWGQQSIDKA